MNMSVLDVLLDDAKVKIVQLTCFSMIDSSDWLNNQIYDLNYLQPPGYLDVPDEVIREFEHVSTQILGHDIKRPKFLSFSQWILEGGTGLQTLWAIFWLDYSNKENKSLIIYHFEHFHPLCYNHLLEWLNRKSKSNQIILLSTNATMLLDGLHRDGVKRYIELRNGKICTIEDFFKKFTGKDYKIYNNAEKAYRDYCLSKEEFKWESQKS